LSRDFRKKQSLTNFHENPSAGSRFFSMRTDGQTDRHDEPNSRERA